MKENKHMPASPRILSYRMWILGALVSALVFFLAAPLSFAENHSPKKQVARHKPAKQKIDKKASKAGIRKINATRSKIQKSRSRVKPLREKLKRPSKTVLAKAFCCVDVSNDQTLLARNEDQQLPVASLTKLTTALVTLDYMPLDRVLTVPEHIKKVPKSVVGLKAGDRLSVEELLHGLLIGSGNDCAETLACAFPGGKQKFVDAMNKKARSMGTSNTLFYTPSGLDRKVAHDAEDKDAASVDSNVSTAREIARIAKVAFSNPKIRSICRKRSYVMASALSVNGYPVRTTNKLLRDNLPVVGGKTGYTSRAGHCLATELAPGGDLLLIVVLGSPDHFGDTRLVYHKALADCARTRAASARLPLSPDRVASRQRWATVR
jgi:D-alanyl-D-alanine carboxypeptidase